MLAGPRALLRAGYFWSKFLVKIMSRRSGTSHSREELQGYYEPVNATWTGVETVRPTILALASLAPSEGDDEQHQFSEGLANYSC